MPGSLAATTRCSRRRLWTPSTITSTKIGTIQNTYDSEVRLDAEQRRAVPQPVHDHRADVAEQDAAGLGEPLRCCSAKYTPMPNIVVNSEWANGAMISRSAAVSSESASDSPPPM